MLGACGSYHAELGFGCGYQCPGHDCSSLRPHRCLNVGDDINRLRSLLGTPLANGELELGSREAQLRRKIVILTSHAFLRGYRKASIHFIASRWAEQGHEVHFLTIGHSWLTLLKDRRRFRALSQDQANRFQTIAANLRAGAYLPPLHAFSSGNRA